MNENNNFSWFETIFTWVKGLAGLALICAVIGFLVEGVKNMSEEEKADAHRRDCLVIPIAGVILVIGCVAIGIGWLLFPAFR